MKLTAIVFVATAAVAAAADTCDEAVLVALAATDEYTGCETDSGFNLTSLTLPDDATVQLMCASAACMILLDDIEALDIGNCTVDTLALMPDLVDPIKHTCYGSSSGSSSVAVVGDSSSSSSTSTDATVTSAPSADSSSSSASGSKSTASLAMCAVTTALAAVAAGML